MMNRPIDSIDTVNEATTKTASAMTIGFSREIESRAA
jgi:hypothetical protein